MTNVIVLINYCYIYINRVKTAFMIQIVQLGQYGFSLVFAYFDPANIGVPDTI
jgi:hypothetical protein